MSDRLLNTDETIKLLNISRPTLYEWMKKGILNPVDMYPSQFKRRPKLKFREEEVRKLMPAEPVQQDESEKPSRTRNKSKAAA
jgi:predicted DNA-binding transcriptional regulator AlpA